MHRRAIIVGVAILLPFAWFFGRVLIGERSFVLFETSYFYYPLFQWIAGEWQAGRIPLWNPQENCGAPVIGDATSSVFYPGKLLFALPFGYPLQFKVYITTHVLLAAIGGYITARRWKRSAFASGQCGLCYAFGGAVLFTYTNVVFLVGAAWLPFAIIAVDALLVQRRMVWAFILAMVLALMTLGGDPQSAYHVGLASILYTLILWRENRRKKRTQFKDRTPESATGFTNPPATLGQRIGTNRFVLLLVAAATGVLLCAVQILPSVRWSWQSERASFNFPRNIYEIPATIDRAISEQPHRSGATTLAWTNVARGLFGQPQRFTHHQDIYEASVAPLRLVELIWPNFSGKVLPDRYYRWIDTLIEAQWATPSLYMGLLPLVLALSSFRIRDREPRVRWMSWLVLLAALGSFGSYGLGWSVNQLIDLRQSAVPDQQPSMGDPVGGVYWMMITLLPGYAQFRDPAKLWVLVAMGLSLLAARGWDRTFVASPERLLTMFRWLGILSVLAALSMLALLPYWSESFGPQLSSQLFGPWNRAGAWLDLVGSMVHTSVICALMYWLLSRVGVSHNKNLQAATLLLTSVEICIASGWMVPSAPDRIYESEPQGVEVISRFGSPDEATGPIRVMRRLNATAAPHAWEKTTSSNRLAEVVQWRRDWFFPRFQLQTDVALVESELSIDSSDFAMLMEISRSLNLQRAPLTGLLPEEFPLPDTSVLDALGARYVIVPQNEFTSAQQRLNAGPNQRIVENVACVQNASHFPRAWIVRKIKRMNPLRDRNPQTMKERTSDIWFPNGEPRDLRHEAVIETELQIKAPGGPSDVMFPQEDICRVVAYDPQRIEMDVRLSSSGLVVLSDLYYPGWTASLRSRGSARSKSLPVLRTNRIMRGVFVPAGFHRLTLEYRPRLFYIGAWISLVSWIMFACLALVRRPWRSYTRRG